MATGRAAGTVYCILMRNERVFASVQWERVGFLGDALTALLLQYEAGHSPKWLQPEQIQLQTASFALLRRCAFFAGHYERVRLGGGAQTKHRQSSVNCFERMATPLTKLRVTSPGEFIVIKIVVRPLQCGKESLVALLAWNQSCGYDRYRLMSHLIFDYFTVERRIYPVSRYEFERVRAFSNYHYYYYWGRAYMMMRWYCSDSAIESMRDIMLLLSERLLALYGECAQHPRLALLLLLHKG